MTFTWPTGGGAGALRGTSRRARQYVVPAPRHPLARTRPASLIVRTENDRGVYGLTNACHGVRPPLLYCRLPTASPLALMAHSALELDGSESRSRIAPASYRNACCAASPGVRLSPTTWPRALI